MSLIGIKKKVCENPHKGWYIHYFDNGIHAYGNKLAKDDYLEDFPGLDHVYLRLAWSYLEPQEGKFNWEIIDKEINRWTAKGYKIAFRITCKETGGFEGNGFATPKWVMEAGAKGRFIEKSGRTDWEPEYGDPVFLQKLENFHKVFAARYSGKPWLAYVDLGSYGDWGEFHTAASSRKEWPFEIIKKHIDIYLKYYKNTQLVISDDAVGSREIQDGSSEKLLAYILANGITFRDDSISVEWYEDKFGFSTVRSPELFDFVWEKYPVVLELEHYGPTIKSKYI
ncbi:MAG: hypothetical protein HC906_06090 [Bacteroidales bacterium]|nr:hypothetical protein [Bacteroidales bacterium]